MCCSARAGKALPGRWRVITSPAVRTAEQPEADRALGEHRVYIADRKVEIASAQAQTRYLEDQRAKITAERASAQLDSRTREVDGAREATAGSGRALPQESKSCSSN